MYPDNAKVSIVMPSLNVAPFIRQCIDSVMNQTLRELEIICVDAGSTDGTLEILQEAAKEDSRIQIIHSDKKSYGYQMNLGIVAATGEYLGIVETDDFVEPEMFERLYCSAKDDNLDVIKSSYYFYWSKPKEKNILYDVTISSSITQIFNPLQDLSIDNQVKLFTKNNSIWSAIYKLSYIRQNGIFFTETPGASFQDTAFALKVWCTAKRVKLLKEAFIHYRQDNEYSSINSTGKTFAICGEYDEVRHYMKDQLVLNNNVLPLIARVQFNGYIWNLYRLRRNYSAQIQFLEKFYQDFCLFDSQGALNKLYYEGQKWDDLQLLLSRPSAFYNKMLCDYYGITYNNLIKQLSINRRKDLFERTKRDRILITVLGSMHYIQKNGFFHFLRTVLLRISNK